MKNSLLTLFLTFSSMFAFSQSDVNIYNNSGCDFRVDMVEYDASCNIIQKDIYYVNAGNSILVGTTNGGEYVDADIIEANSGCYITSISATMSSCVSCSGNYPTSVVSASCGTSCTANYTFMWYQGCSTPGTGDIEIF